MYDNEYDIDDYSDLNENNLVKYIKSFRINKNVLIILIIIIVLIVAFSTYQKTIVYQDSYEYLEELLEENARNYVNANNLKSDKEFYIEANKLNVTLKSDCKSVSGVFVNGSEYNAYLMCDSYESKLINNDNEYIKLNGRDITFLNKGNEYVESSYEEFDNVSVNIDGIVGTEEGVYELRYVVFKYSVFKTTLTRKIVVLNNSEIDSFYPSIKLLGNEIEYLKIRENYTEKGAVGTDIKDGPINDVKINGKVNTNNDGEYNLTYVVVNSNGYASAVKRKVVVLKDGEKIAASSIITPPGLTNENVKIIMNVFGNNYAYTKLPNDQIINTSLIEYQVTENGKYNFVIYDNENNYIIETVEVTNINKTPPNGSCNALVYSNYTDITVNASSNVGISGYNYIVDNKQSGYISSFNYKHSSGKSISVKVKDIIGNVKTIDCNIKYMDPTIGNNNVKYYVGFNDEYVIPKTKNNVDEFVRRVKGKISQNANVEECGDACLSFSLYHGYYLQYGNMNEMNLDAACHYRYPIRYDIIYSMNKQEILRHVYNEIFAGRVVVLQVRADDHRHFVLVVGYRRSVYDANSLTEDDLIYIDSWGGTFNSMANPGAREMFNDKDRGGYRVDKIKSQYYSLWP